MKRSGGYTLVEILTVICIIGVLTALLLPNLMNARQRARDAKLKVKLKQFQTALRAYYNDKRTYPAIGNINFPIAITGPTSIYMKEQMSELKYYNVMHTGSAFDGVVSCVNLENTGDKEITDSQQRCFNGSVPTTELANWGCPVKSCYCDCIQ